MVYDVVYNKDMKYTFDEILHMCLLQKYYTSKELCYSNKPGTYLDPYNLEEYRKYVDSLIKNGNFTNALKVLKLKPFNSEYIYYFLNNELINYNHTYLDLLKDDDSVYNSFLFERKSSSIKESIIYSEIEGSLNVENVPTTRRRLKELLELNKKPLNNNDVVIVNMKKALDFIFKKPSFNKENLYKLYNILSKGCLDDYHKLKDNEYYRYDAVEVDGYNGAPVDKINECMDSLFNYVNEEIESFDIGECPYIGHIVHYYIVYVHPYFDFNGRTARLASIWVNILANDMMDPPLISEAINQNKNEYYSAIRESRNAHNDITYFLNYVLKTTIKYYLTYKDLDEIDQYCKNNGIILTETELNYIKRILVTYKGKFSYKDFVSNAKIEISKQGAFKILNKFVQNDILIEVKTDSKTKLFDINRDIIVFTRN